MIDRLVSERNTKKFNYDGYRSFLDIILNSEGTNLALHNPGYQKREGFPMNLAQFEENFLFYICYFFVYAIPELEDYLDTDLKKFGLK